MNISEALSGYVNEVQRIHNEYFAENYKNLDAPSIEVSFGKKYAKLIRVDNQRSVHSFVALVDNPKKGEKAGDILKPASWNAPAKKPRGTIFKDNGTGSLTPQGFVHYLRGY